MSWANKRQSDFGVSLLLLTLTLMALVAVSVQAVPITVITSDSPVHTYFPGTAHESSVFFAGDTLNLDLTQGVAQTHFVNLATLNTGANDMSFDTETQSISYSLTIDSQSTNITYDITANVIANNQFQFDYDLLTPATVTFDIGPQQFLDITPLPVPSVQTLANSGGGGSLVRAVFLLRPAPVTTPEPITCILGLMGLGVLGMVTRRRAA